MFDEAFRKFGFNGTDKNESLGNSTDNSTPLALYTLGPTSVMIISICITLGTYFSALSIYNYARNASYRTYFTYIFHYMLIYCLISSLINAPIYLVGYYQNLFDSSSRLCQYYSVNALTINTGMVTCLAYTSLERHYLLFRRNGPLTWKRQIVPFTCLFLYSFVISLIFTFIPQCDSTTCTPCYTTHLTYMLIWLSVSFILPQSIMLISTVVLIVRLCRRRTASFNHVAKGSVYYRVFIQMAFYVIWSCLYYCPPTFYNLAMIVNPSHFSPSTKSAMNIANTISVQSYSMLTFFLMVKFHKKK